MPVPDMGAIAALAASLQAATDISKAMIGLRDTSLLQGKVIELQGVILSAQQSALSAQMDQFSMLERVRELEKQIAELKAWDAEKQNYELGEVANGAFAYVLKPTAQTGEPPHWLCAACYQQGHKSFLQDNGRTATNRESVYKCSHCKGSILVPWSRHPGKQQEAPAKP